MNITKGERPPQAIMSFEEGVLFQGAIIGTLLRYVWTQSLVHR